MEEGRAENVRRVKRTMQEWQGTISFEKTLGTAATSKCGVLTLPARLWQKHGDKVQKFVILQSAADRKMWTVEVQIYFPHKRPQVVFRGSWRSFVVGNGLVKGDRLKFTLTGRSKFEVVILPLGGDPKVPVVLRPKRMSNDSESSQRHAKISVARHYIDMTREISVKSERVFNGSLFANDAGMAEDSIAHSALNIICVQASSESPSDMGSQFFEPSEFPSDMDSHFYEPMLQKNEQEGALSRSFNNTGCHVAQGRHVLPRFCKRIRGSYVLEIPCKFLMSHWTQIGTHAKLQGIHESSQVYTVMYTCVISEGRPRLFFKSSCWDNFLKDNCLQIGQKLSFTLTAHSSFAVRNAE